MYTSSTCDLSPASKPNEQLEQRLPFCPGRRSWKQDSWVVRVAYLAGGGGTVGLELKVLIFKQSFGFDCPSNHEQKLKKKKKNIKSIEENIVDLANLVKVMTTSVFFSLNIFSMLISAVFVTWRLGFYLTTTKRGYIYISKSCLLYWFLW